jgi:hypothetical protein
MKIKHVWAILFAAALLVFPAARGAAQQDQNPSQTGMDMSHMDKGQMHHDTAEQPDAASAANASMSDMHMNMNPHMFMTDLHPANGSDQRRAEDILKTLRRAIEKYKDYHAALEDGFQIFLPQIPQPHYHFTNWRYAYEAEFVFNPEHPTSLLYKKAGSGYELEGAMYTAPRRDAEEQLNERVPLSVARWHKHVNLCMPPKGTPQQQVDRKKFGLGGSIATENACEEAGGRWTPQIFNWMVHVYPYEHDPEKIWAH